MSYKDISMMLAQCPRYNNFFLAERNEDNHMVGTRGRGKDVHFKLESKKRKKKCQLR